MSRRIETIAVAKVNKVLSRSKKVAPYINDNDKTPNWDGNLFIYKNISNNGNNKKENLIGKIPTQVKGKSVSELNKKDSKYSFKVSDLRSYYRDGGVILFVVEIIENHQKKIYQERVFYSTLLPYDLKNKLDNINSNQKSLTIKLRYLDPDKINFFELDCINFISDKEKQYSTRNFNLPVEEAVEKFITIKANKKNFANYILSHEFYVYGKKDKNWPVSITIDKVSFSAIKGEIKKGVVVNGEKHFDSYYIEQKTNYIKFIFENNLSLKIKGEKSKFNYKYHDNFKKRLKCMGFINHMINNNGFSIDNKFIGFNFENTTDKIEELISEYKYLEKIATLLDYFDIDYNKLNLNKINKKEEKLLKILIDKVIYDKQTSVTFNNLPSLYKFKIGNINILCMVYEVKGEIKIQDIEEVKGDFSIVKNNENIYNVSPYIALSYEDLLDADNLNPVKIKNSVVNSNYDEFYSQQVILLVLKLIKIYDETKNHNYLEESLGIIKWLKKHENNNPVHTINESQIYKRKRDLNIVEKNELHKIIQDFKDYNDYLQLVCCVYILLDDFNTFEEYFEQLNSSEKDKFKNYPIYSLYENQ